MRFSNVDMILTIIAVFVSVAFCDVVRRDVCDASDIGCTDDMVDPQQLHFFEDPDIVSPQ